MGYVLRDIYFAEKLDQTMFQQHQMHLEKWLANLPGPLRRQIEYGLIDKTPQDQYEAVVCAYSKNMKSNCADALIV